MRLIIIFGSCFAIAANVLAAPAKAPQASPQERLAQMRAKVLKAEADLLALTEEQSQGKVQIQRLQTLMSLQKQEVALSRARLVELEKGLKDLEVRKAQIKESLVSEQKKVRQTLEALLIIEVRAPVHIGLDVDERSDAPSRESLARLASRTLRSVEELRIDLDDASQIEARIHQEQSELVAVMQDLKERETVLELNRQIQADMISKRHQEKLAQLREYHRLKLNQNRVEDLLSQFQARQEISATLGRERLNPSAEFMKQRGKLKLPVLGSSLGSVLRKFGPDFDPVSKLQVFRKGVEIGAKPSQPVNAVFKGKLIFAGNLPQYGNAVVIDHGDHFYSLSGRLGEIRKNVGDWVETGEQIAQADPAATSVYFEIRSRNIALNPLQWVSR